jgi:Zn-dependent M28 family amino/carboxypeptidase
MSFVRLSLGCGLLIGLLSVARAGGPGPEPSPVATRGELQGILGYLASDLLEGRAPGTRGGNLAEAYVESLLRQWGLEPGWQGGYLQPFLLKGYTTEKLLVQAAGVALKLGADVMGTFAADQEKFELSAQAVFVGFGIATELWDWDDFKGVDLRGKFLLARVNDPGLFDPAVFDGKALTYFGRWTYHIEEARRRGAAGILLIHTDATAGYGWSVVQSSWGGESLHLQEEVNSDLKWRGWVREAALRKVLQAKGLDLDALYRASLSRDFRPVPLGFPITVRGSQRLRQVTVNNVVAEIPGKSQQRIVLSAHLDHLGLDDKLSGDRIFNGAIDNGSAIAALLLTAKRLNERRGERSHTLVVLACQAEESGLLGSKYYVAQADRSRLLADINFESTPVWERAGSIMGIGASFSTLEDALQGVARQKGWATSEFSMVEQGFFFRSDQFAFAQRGIPSVWISAGEDDASGQRKYTTFWKTDYHTVRDEVHADWPLGGLEQTIEAAVALVESLDQSPAAPRWKRKLTFPVLEDAPARR